MADHRNGYERIRDSLRPVAIGGVWLMREGDKVNVYVERNGTYYLAISEFWDNNFSHNISAEGIRSLGGNDIPAWLSNNAARSRVDSQQHTDTSQE